MIDDFDAIMILSIISRDQEAIIINGIVLISETIETHKAVSRAIIQINQTISLDPVNDGSLMGGSPWVGARHGEVSRYRDDCETLH